MSDRLSKRSWAQPSCPSPPKKVLLVDGQFGELSCLSETLKEHGCEVSFCNRHADGLRQLESECFDFIVLCQSSPEFEGRPALARAIEIGRRTPILVVTRCLDMKCHLEATEQAWHFRYVAPNRDGEDSDNWEAFYYPIGARKFLDVVASLLPGVVPPSAERWDELLVD